jgi:hypothetical protein
MVQAAKNRMRNKVSEALDWAHVGSVLPERNVSLPFVIVGSIFCKDSPKVLCVENYQMVKTFASDRPDQAFNIYPFCQGERNDVGRSRMPIARMRALNVTPNALRTKRRPIASMRRSCSDSPVTASQMDGVFGIDSTYAGFRRSMPPTITS